MESGRLPKMVLRRYDCVLSLQAEVTGRDRDVQGCDCIKGDKEIRNVSTAYEDSINDGDDDFFAWFVWATGGHSSAAGHGNLFNESYTRSWREQQRMCLL